MSELFIHLSSVAILGIFSITTVQIFVYFLQNNCWSKSYPVLLILLTEGDPGGPRPKKIGDFENWSAVGVSGLLIGASWLGVAGCGWMWLGVAGCGWVWLGVGGCGWIRYLVTT